MEIFGIGPLELAFILLLALIILGPREMQRAGKTLGRWLNQLIHSEIWQTIQQTSHQLRNLPTELMRSANLEDHQEFHPDQPGLKPGDTFQVLKPPSGSALGGLDSAPDAPVSNKSPSSAPENRE